MLIPILKKRAVYLKGIAAKAEHILKTEKAGSINHTIARENFICAKAALAELIVIEHEINKLNPFGL